MLKQTYRITLVIAGLTSALAFAQEAEKKEEVFGWNKDLVGSINLTQIHYSDNWTQGGENSLAWKALLGTLWENNQPKSNWRNTAKLVYGQIKQSDDELRKSDDEIKVESVLTYKAGTYLNPYVAFNGLTQFTKGYVYSDTGKTEVSNFFDPAYLRESLGLGYKPSANFITRLGISFKQTIADRHRLRYGNKADQSVRVETGIESTTDFTQKIEENVLFKSKLELFTAFENISAVDMIWDNTLTGKISKYFAVTASLYLFYDEDILKELQIKQALDFGITYTFF
jgi:hypothetical protein